MPPQDRNEPLSCPIEKSHVLNKAIKMPILRRVFGVFFSTKCVGCGLETPVLGLCKACITRLTPRRGTRCPLCDRLLGIRGKGFKCGDCLRRAPKFERVFGIYDYESPAGRAVSFGKYTQCPEAIDWIGRRVAENCPLTLLDDPPDVVMAVPLAWKRIIERGFNAPQVIAYRVAQVLGRPFLNQGLKRTRHTPVQTGLDVQARRRNVRGAFSVTKKLPTNVLLVDDVYTTGSTVSEVSAVLSRHGVTRIRVLTACYVDDPNHRPIPTSKASE